ncbi:MAG: asparagine synthase (glutamine-hydrolyzing) [Anaerolineales bacterium]
MCGITGIFNDSSDLLARVSAMSNALRHRGPDDSGVWADPAAGVALGFRRLAILDLSPSGHQPMTSASGRFTLIFNGEIYNYQALRAELSAAWRGASDTEVILAGFEAWGVAETVRRLNGMFAFAVWDARERALTLARDRLGIKPLYYGWSGGVFLFGSELKSLRAHPAFAAEIDREALALYLRLGNLPAPHSIYQNVKKLPPACLLTLRADAPRSAAPAEYWSAREIIQSGLERPFGGSEREAVDRLEEQLRRSIGLRMLADVPLGAFLSGGIDSSLVVALMQTQSARPVKTFSLGFAEAGYDESAQARAVARRLHTEHSEFIVTPAEAQAVIPRLPLIYDEPFADSSQIPTLLVSQMARQHVTVALSGDGGDELFGGYNRYRLVEKLWRRMKNLPPGARHLLAASLTGIRPALWSRLAGRFLPNPADKAAKLAETLLAQSPQAIYLNLISQWKNPLELMPGGREACSPLHEPAAWLKGGTQAERMMALDFLTYLPDDILTKVDRASMAVSLEARAPLLDDHETIEMAWRLPLNLKIRGGQGKWILRQILARHLPARMMERPKQGFAIPLHSWLRGPLRPWAEALLDENRLRREGFFAPAPIRQKWRAHLSGQSNEQAALWTILMFGAWLESEK